MCQTAELVFHKKSIAIVLKLMKNPDVLFWKNIFSNKNKEDFLFLANLIIIILVSTC